MQDEIKKKVKDIKKPETKAAIEKLVTDFVKKHNLAHGASGALHDQYSLINDPGLKPVKEQCYKDGRNAQDKLGSRSLRPISRIGSKWGRPPIHAVSAGLLDNMSPEARFLDDSSTFYLTWKTEETKAKIPKKLDNVKDQVVAAWKRQKARDLAQEAANALQKKVRDRRLKTWPNCSTSPRRTKSRPFSWTRFAGYVPPGTRRTCRQFT